MRKKKVKEAKQKDNILEIKQKVLKKCGEEIAQILSNNKLRFIVSMTIGEKGVRPHIQLEFVE